MKQIKDPIVVNDHYYNVQPVLFLDLDGTVRESKRGKMFIQSVQDIKIKDYVVDIIRSYKSRGYLIIAITNQGGVAYGIKTEEEVREELKITNRLCDGLFDFMLYSPFHPKGTHYPYNIKSQSRKPSTGMIMEAESGLFFELGTQIDYAGSLFVGDSDEDKMCAFNAGIKFIWANEFFSSDRIKALLIK